MKSKLLLPTRFKWIGLLLLIPFAVMGALFMFNHFEFDALAIATKSADGLTVRNNNLTDEIALTGTVISLLMIAFAREKEEDEFIHFTRLESWQWAVVVNFALLLVAVWTVYDFQFLNVMVYNMLTILILFIVRFQFMIYKNKRAEIKSFAL